MKQTAKSALSSCILKDVEVIVATVCGSYGVKVEEWGFRLSSSSSQL